MQGKIRKFVFLGESGNCARFLTITYQDDDVSRYECEIIMNEARLRKYFKCTMESLIVVLDCVIDKKNGPVKCIARYSAPPEAKNSLSDVMLREHMARQLPSLNNLLSAVENDKGFPVGLITLTADRAAIAISSGWDYDRGAKLQTTRLAFACLKLPIEARPV